MCGEAAATHLVHVEQESRAADGTRLFASALWRISTRIASSDMRTRRCYEDLHSDMIMSATIYKPRVQTKMMGGKKRNAHLSIKQLVSCKISFNLGAPRCRETRGMCAPSFQVMGGTATVPSLHSSLIIVSSASRSSWSCCQRVDCKFTWQS